MRPNRVRSLFRRCRSRCLLASSDLRSLDQRPLGAPSILLITGCLAGNTWDPTGGRLVRVDRLADALLDPVYARDGVSVLGGEPFYQPEWL
jgi:organic radical activating enzyme